MKMSYCGVSYDYEPLVLETTDILKDKTVDLSKVKLSIHASKSPEALKS